MFVVYCPGHGSRVLLFAEHIEQLVNGVDGIEVHWHCACGATGVTPIRRPHHPLVAA